MPSKQVVLNSITPRTYGYAEVKSLVNSVSVAVDSSEVAVTKHKPPYPKKGDVFKMFTGMKNRPVVVAKVLSDVVIGIPLSTTEDYLNLHGFKSRMFGENFLSKNIVVTSHQSVVENFIGVLEDPKNLNTAIRKMQDFILKNLTTR